MGIAISTVMAKRALTLGYRLLSWRKSKKLTQREAADAVGVDQSTWSDWENDNSGPRVAQAIEVIRVTGLPIEALARPRKSRDAA